MVAGIGLLIYSLLTGSVFAQNLADSGGILLFLWKAAVSVLPKPPDNFDRPTVVRGIDMQIWEAEADPGRVAYLCSVRSQWAEGMGRGCAGQMQSEPAACRK